MNNNNKFPDRRDTQYSSDHHKKTRSITFRLAPINELSARHMIESTKASRLLYGVRGDKPSDIESIVESLQRLSQLVMDFPAIQEIDVNP